jgi:hypothetical protein
LTQELKLNKMGNRIKQGKKTVGAVVQIPKATHKAIKKYADLRQEKTEKSYTIMDGILHCLEVGAKEVCDGI